MQTYLKLAAAVLMPVLASVFVNFLDKKTVFRKLSESGKQLIIGILFGLLAILATELGFSVAGATLNVRDAAPLCAGFLFGAPAGIYAGLIGGIERYFAAAWGAGEYTKFACSLSTIFAGISAAWLRKYVFDDKRPQWYYGLAVGGVAEVVHMLAVFLTHLDDAHGAFAVVHPCAVPMILLNSVSVGLAILIVALLNKEPLRRSREQTPLSETFQGRLLICVIAAFFVTSLFTYQTQTSLSDSELDNSLRISLTDAQNDLAQASDEQLLSVTRMIANEINSLGAADSATLTAVAKRHYLTEINVIGPDGIISASTDPNNVGFDMASGEQAAEFLVLLEPDKAEYAQSFQPLSRDGSISRKYGGVKLRDGGFVQVGYTAEEVHANISKQILLTGRYRHVGTAGFLIICDQEFRILSDRENFIGKTLRDTRIQTDQEDAEEFQRFSAKVYDEDMFCMFTTTEGYYILGMVPAEEALFSRNMALYITVFMEVLIFSALFIMVYFLIRRRIVVKLEQVNGSLSRITNGDLDVSVDVRSNAEFVSLSDGINSTIVTLKRYIAEAAARIDQELEFASSIQASVLPEVRPPYADHPDFDIAAGMFTAREVGGDFYDFYLVDADHLVFLVADVSGKGIPAAMFMMRAKTAIRNLSEAGLPADEVFTHANAQLCEGGDDTGMFVTAWMGVLDLRTGELKFVNAGHNPPLLRHADGGFSYLRTRPALVLAGMEDTQYPVHTLTLAPGDTVFLYTDGVTEATSLQKELYGEQRLAALLNTLPAEQSAQALCGAVKQDVDAFVGEASQFDDITMLCLRFRPNKN